MLSKPESRSRMKSGYSLFDAMLPYSPLAENQKLKV